MKKVNYQDNWPDSWKLSYNFDLIEIYGDKSSSGFAYAYTNRRKHTLDLIKKVAPPSARILDIAAAQGNFSLTLAEIGYEVTWNDLREELADYVKLKHESGIIHYAPGNIFALNFDADFDVILITEIIEHVAHPDEFLKKCSQLLKPKGHIVMSTPNGEYFRYKLPRFSDCPNPEQFEEMQFQPDSNGHIFLLHIDEVYKLAAQSDLTVVETKLFTNSLTNGHIKLGTLLKWLPHKWVDACETFTSFLPYFLQKKLHTSLAVLFSR